MPVSFIMSRTPGVTLFRIGPATPCSTIVQIILCGIYFTVLKKKEKAKA